VSEQKPMLIDKFLEDAIEVEVDAICDGEEVFIPAIMEHIEEAGVHSGDAACVIPPISLSKEIMDTIEDYTRKIALALQVKGLINVQYAVKDGVVYVLEANPRASRTVPFVSKATGIPLAKIATKVALGKKLKDFNLKKPVMKHFAVKEAVFPFIKLPGVDVVLGPEMKSTGEVMGIDYDFGIAYYKAELGAGMRLPLSGNILISVKDADKPKALGVAKKFAELGFKIYATEKTAKFLREHGIEAEIAFKVSQGRPNIVDMIINGQIDLIINTPSGKTGKTEGYEIRRTAVEYGVPYITTIPGAIAAAKAIEAVKKGKLVVKSINEYHEEVRRLS
ncbi:MAG: ATP-grasp domain-containing protein, partial [Archaeoglobaceae archaeon]